MSSAAKKLKAPFWGFGGKARAAAIVWPRLGPVANYIEPFCNTAAMLLKRPDEPRIETINDVNCYVANFWRAIQRDPEAVAAYADGPVNEVDLHARHRWLVLSDESASFRRRMRLDPDYFNARIAGWWCWGLCCWIGGGWCDIAHRNASNEPRPNFGPDGHGNGVNRPTKQQVPDLGGDSGAAGRGIHASGVDRKRPYLGDWRVSWVRRPAISQDGQGVTCQPSEQRPDLEGKGVGGKRVRLSARSERDIGTGVHKVKGANKKPILQNGSGGLGHGVNSGSVGTCETRHAWLLDWFADLADRLRCVRVCSGHWLRVCNSPSVTTRLGLTGVFLDPPYPAHAPDGSRSRDGELYASDRHGTDATDRLRDEVLAWCHERGGDSQMRIAVCGYDTDGYAELEQRGWICVPWRAHGGYGNRARKQNDNPGRERIWFSPHCLNPDAAEGLPLFPLEVKP
jgi:hypothetical protein